MRRLGRAALRALLFTLVAAMLAITIAPFYLDRIYYRGAAGDHFDGARFFNPDGDDTAAPPGGGSRAGFLWRNLAGSDGRPEWPDRIPVRPARPEPRVDGDLMVATWIGHATVLVQTQGLNILTDPIWSDTAGPFGFGPRRAAAPGVRLADLPRIDLILVSHNHYDHLDLDTLRALWRRDRPRIVTSLGNDSVVRQAGVPAIALDWGGRHDVRPDIAVVATRNHHWGSRWFADRNRALWSSFVVTLPGGNLFFAGDTGLGDGRWPAAAAALGPVRLALIPIGAFRFVPGQMASGSHIGPIDALRVLDGLGAAHAMPIHWGTFRLSYEGRDTPPAMLAAMMRCAGVPAARFAPIAIGAAREIGRYAPPAPIAPARIRACARTPAVTAPR